jgi:hypothetical protein
MDRLFTLNQNGWEAVGMDGEDKLVFSGELTVDGSVSSLKNSEDEVQVAY